jgi:hypothetical protein
LGRYLASTNLQASLEERHNHGFDKWPKTLKAAKDILSEHVLDAKWTPVAQRDRRGNHNGVTLNQGGKDLSHITCNCCGVKGHYSTGCPKVASIAPDKWFKPKNPVLAQGGTEPEDEQSEPETDTEQERSGTGSNQNRRSCSRAHNCCNSQEAEETDDEDGWAAVQVKSDDEPVQRLVLKQQSKWTSLAGKIILDQDLRYLPPS